MRGIRKRIAKGDKTEVRGEDAMYGRELFGKARSCQTQKTITRIWYTNTPQAHSCILYNKPFLF
ncbi:MAG: hypothetical protein BGP14_08005 [Sphingobacteriales bacterium 44-15]|nr:MAG: hypothetical protein BGP14_08005 [Sphingobacteriales bacterium 44-15]